jgi:hypothetical protein
MKIRIHITTRIGNKDMSLNFNQEPFDSHRTTVLKLYLLLYKNLYLNVEHVCETDILIVYISLY